MSRNIKSSFVQKARVSLESEQGVRTAGSPSKNRVVRLLLTILMGLVAGMIVFYFPALPQKTLAPSATGFLPAPTFSSTPTSVSTPSERLVLLVSNETPTFTLLPTTTPIASITREFPCQNIQPVRAAVGQIAMVRLDPSIPGQIREEPSMQSSILGRIRTGEFFIIVDGPLCADDYVWWKVQSARGLLGWIAESYVSSYWLMTPTSVSPELIKTPAPVEGSISPTTVSAPQLYRILTTNDIPISVSWSPDGTRLASGSGGCSDQDKCEADLAIRIWDWVQGKQLSATLIKGRDITTVDWSPDGNRLLSGQAMQIRDSLNGELLVKMDPTWPHCRRVRWSPNGLLLAGGCHDGSVYIWDASTGEQLRKLSGHQSLVTDTAWSPNGQQIATSSYDGTIRVWDVLSGQQRYMLKNEGSDCHDDSPCRIGSIAWSPDGSQIAFGDKNLNITTWNPVSGELHAIGFHTHRSATDIYAVAWSPDGNKLASTDGKSISVWGLGNGLFSYILDPGNVEAALGVAWSPDGKYLAVTGLSRSAHRHGLVWVWNIP